MSRPATASTHCTVVGVARLTLPLRRCWSHEANVEYFTPTDSANAAAVIPLRSYSSKICSRFSRGVLTRPRAS